jgi:hypothetical protein
VHDFAGDRGAVFAVCIAPRLLAAMIIGRCGTGTQSLSSKARDGIMECPTGQHPDQQTSFTTDFDRQAAGYSPDRVDALVWAFTELLVTPMPSYAAYEIARERAEAVIEQRRAEEEARRPKLVPAKGSVELLKDLNNPR